MPNLRRVEVTRYRWEFNTELRKNERKLASQKLGWFHAWGLEHVEGEDSSVATDSIAIVELDDGTVETHPADSIRFLEPVKP
jgi:hypothetical protein